MHNSQTETAEEIRFQPASDKLPSIAELRHTSDEQQHQLGPPLFKADSVVGDGTILPAGLPKPPEALGTLNLTQHTTSSQTQQHPEAHTVPLPVKPGPAAQQAHSGDSSRSDSSGSGSSSAVAIGVGSISSGIDFDSRSSISGGSQAGAGGILEPHSRAGDGSEQELLPGHSTEYEAPSDDYLHP